MKVVSLFDGISCGRLALQRAGINVTRYVAFEIDKDAINVSRWNWDDIEQRGSVEGADFTEFKGFDLVMGGFPCTDLSIGKNIRQGLKGQHSRLFWEQVRAIKEINPRYFLVENNYRMPKKDEAIITETLGVEPIHINSAKVSAQNRDRLYWTNIPNVGQPEDKGIVLADVLLDKVSLKYYHSTGGLDYLFAEGVKKFNRPYKIIDGAKDKSPTLVSVFTKGLPYNALAVNRVGYFGELNKTGKVPHGAGLYDAEGKSLCLTTSTGSLGNYALAFRTRDTDQGRFKKPEVRVDEKSNALTTVQTDSMLAEKAYCLTSSYGRAYVPDVNRRQKTQILEQPTPGVPLFLVEDGKLLYKERLIPVKLSDGLYAIRKLTPVECERLQTLPDGYTEMVSDTQRYRQLGNGWTVDVIAHIFNHIHLDDLL